MSFSNFKNEDNKVALAIDLKNEKRNMEGNKVIAEFSGFIRKDRPIPSGGWKHWHIEPFGYFEDEQLEYHTSWDWLMPVVEKIGKMYDPYKYKAYETREDAWSIVDLTIMNPINEVYDSVVEFINWYNQNKK